MPADPITSETLTALLAGATPGPWRALEDGRAWITLIHVETDEGCPAGIGVLVCSIPCRRAGDADLIALAPTLAAEVLTLRARVAELEAVVAALGVPDEP